MDGIIELVRKYQGTRDVDQRVQFGDELICQIETDLRFFIYRAAPHHIAQDICQDVLIAIVTGLTKFQGGSTSEFWGWCYRIARNKINDHFRRSATEANYLLPMPLDELWLLVENSPDDVSLSAEDREDLNSAMKLLIQAKPDCYELLWQHFILGLDYGEIAAERNLSYDGTRMKIGRCLDNARALVT